MASTRCDSLYSPTLGLIASLKARSQYGSQLGCFKGRAYLEREFLERHPRGLRCFNQGRVTFRAPSQHGGLDAEENEAWQEVSTIVEFAAGDGVGVGCTSRAWTTVDGLGVGG